MSSAKCGAKTLYHSTTHPCLLHHDLLVCIRSHKQKQIRSPLLQLPHRSTYKSNPKATKQRLPNSRHFPSMSPFQLYIKQTLSKEECYTSLPDCAWTRIAAPTLLIVFHIYNFILHVKGRFDLYEKPSSIVLIIDLAAFVSLQFYDLPEPPWRNGRNGRLTNGLGSRVSYAAGERRRGRW